MWLLIKNLEFSASGATQNFNLDFFLINSSKLKGALVIHLQTYEKPHKTLASKLRMGTTAQVPLL